MGAGVDFFDLDHTLIRGSSGVLFVVKGVRQGLFPAGALLYIPFYSLLFYTGWLRSTEGEGYFSSLRGRRRDELQQLAAACLPTLRKWVYPEVRALIRSLKDRGCRVVLATSSLRLIAEPLAAELGLDAVIATALEFDGERCTGRFVEGPLLKDRKKVKVLEYLQELGMPAASCSFYSDSAYDLPLLETVGNPVAVNPDFRLRAAARRRGWQVLRFR
jgi:HAD superfamily hydrolase (TIGR01490 family)